MIQLAVSIPDNSESRAETAGSAARPLLQTLRAVAEARSRGKDVVLATVVEDRSGRLILGTRLVVTEGEVLGASIDPETVAVIREDSERSRVERRSYTRSYRRTEDGGVRHVPVRESDFSIFFEVIARPLRLVIVGCGHIALPLARIAKLLEFEIVVIDDRPEFANRERFPDVDRVIVGPYRESVRSLEIDSNTYVVLVTRGHVHDTACLEEVLPSPATYIGMIGSRRRVRTVMARLQEQGWDPLRLKSVHAPVGLDIGAVTPAEIAVSIMAEIVNLQRDGQAPSLALGERLRV